MVHSYAYFEYELGLLLGLHAKLSQFSTLNCWEGGGRCTPSHNLGLIGRSMPYLHKLRYYGMHCCTSWLMKSYCKVISRLLYLSPLECTPSYLQCCLLNLVTFQHRSPSPWPTLGSVPTFSLSLPQQQYTILKANNLQFQFNFHLLESCNF